MKKEKMTKKKTTTETQPNKENEKNNGCIGCLTFIVIILLFGIITSKCSTSDNKTETESPKSNTDSTHSEKTPEEELEEQIVNILDSDHFVSFEYQPENASISITFKGSENLTHNMTVETMYMDMSKILEVIQPDSNFNVNVSFNITYPLSNVYGESEETLVITATFSNQTIQRIDFENFDFKNIPAIADEWWNHEAANLVSIHMSRKLLAKL